MTSISSPSRGRCSVSPGEPGVTIGVDGREPTLPPMSGSHSDARSNQSQAFGRWWSGDPRCPLLVLLPHDAVMPGSRPSGPPGQAADRVRLGRARHGVPPPAHRRDGADAVRRLRLPRHDAPTPRGQAENFTWLCWGRRAFSEAELKPALDDLKATTVPAVHPQLPPVQHLARRPRLVRRPRRRRGQRPARRPGRPRGRCAGHPLRRGGIPGRLFTYAKQRDAKTKSWDEYAAQARRRGREVMEAFQEGFPDLTVFLTFGHSLPRTESGRGKKPLAGSSYGLLAPFLDGMVEAAKGRSRLVDGFELSYGYKEPAKFDEGYRLMKEGVLPIVADPGSTGGSSRRVRALARLRLAEEGLGRRPTRRGTTSRPRRSRRACVGRWSGATSSSGSTPRRPAGGPSRAGGSSCPTPTRRRSGGPGGV